MLTVALAGVYVTGLGFIRHVARRDLATSALQALAIAFPAVPFVGPSLLNPLFGPDSAILIVAAAPADAIVGKRVVDYSCQRAHRWRL